MSITRYENFSINEIKEGIFAVIDNDITDRHCSGSNSGIIDFGNFTVLFDTLLSIDAAKELFKAAKDLTNKYPAIVINSHEHLDHFHGNQVCGEGMTIITSRNIWQSMQKQKDEFPNRKMMSDSELAELEERIKAQQEPEKLNSQNTLLYMRNMSVKDSFIKMPNVVFENALTIAGDKRTAELKAYQNAHSVEDLVLILENDKTAFMGDLLFVEQHPWLGDGNPLILKKYLEGFINKGLIHFVPGHGKCGGEQDVLDQIEYIDYIVEYCRKIKRGEEKSAETMPAKFEKWDPLCYSWNIATLVKKAEIMGS
jgi:cyclase